MNTLLLVCFILSIGNIAGAHAGSKRPSGYLVSSEGRFHSPASQRQSTSKDKSSGTNTNVEPSLSESQKSLMEGSKAAILKTGMSAPYFAEHFRVVDVIDKPGDRRVIWRFSLNEYEATVNDSIGYYTDGGKRINIHSIANLLPSTSDIRRTIPRARALKIMAACLGKFSTTAVEYQAGASGKAGLFLTAASIPRPARPNRRETRERERERKAREARENAGRTTRQKQDVIEEDEEENRPPIFLGAVNLETGKCRKGIAQAGPPKVR